MDTIAADSALSLVELSDWIGDVVTRWVAWSTDRDSEWLLWPTGNERFSTLGHLFIHAFSPMHRYADQVVGVEPADDSHINAHSWVALTTWAHQCQQRHREVSAMLGDAAGQVVDFHTRSAGVLQVSAAEALTQAVTHCYWHLGGVSHMLRLGGIAPPGGGDFIQWAAARRRPADISA
jgi:uncharacterized damage-inducible protein DinB